MRKAILIAVGVLATIVVVLLVAIAMQPAEFKYTRTATIAAPPVVVFEQVNDFQKWRAWSPWENKDPNLKRTYSGAAEGVGAKYHWVGNSEVGEGQMTITESKPGELVRIKLEFIAPFASVCPTEFTFKPEQDQTVVTWTMQGENGFMGKAMGLLMDMNGMIETSFDEGLASMKTVAEAAAQQANDAVKEK